MNWLAFFAVIVGFPFLLMAIGLWVALVRRVVAPAWGMNAAVCVLSVPALIGIAAMYGVVLA